MRELLKIALRNVLRNRRRSALTLSAIFLSVAVQLGVRGMLNGLQTSIRDSVILGGMGALQIHRAGYLKQVIGAPITLDIPADEPLLQKVRSTPHVKAASARIQFGSMANAKDTTVFAMVTALDPAHEYEVCPRRGEDLASGTLLGAGDPSGALLAAELKRRLQLGPGESGALLAADRDGVLNGIDFHPVGVINGSRLPGGDQKIAAVPLALAQELLRMPGRATEIAVAVDDMRNLEATKAALQSTLGPGFEVSTWHDVAPFVDDIVKGQDTVLSFVASVFLLVALIGIANTMLMNVLERTREIGAMMAMGVRRRQIAALFAFEAGLLAAFGALPGAAMGGGLVHYLATRDIVFKIPTGAMQHITPSLTPGYVVGVVLAASLGATLAALYPAWKASRLRPVEALSHA